MMKQTIFKNTVSISIDLKKYRLRIHRNTLKALSKPKYVQLMINPTNMTIAILGSENARQDSHKVNLHQLGEDNSFELYSKNLINELKAIIPNINYGSSYRLYGNKLVEENIVIFPLTSIQNDEKRGV